MNIEIVEITGYVPAIASMYITNKNLDIGRLNDIKDVVSAATDRWGKVINSSPEFRGYMDKLSKYGIKHEHETILDFIKISVFMEELHRGAQDNYDAHAKRMDIIRSSTRANKKSTTNPEISDWYKDKIKFASNLKRFEDNEGVMWEPTPFGYVRSDLIKDNDTLRGLVPLSLASDNISTMSYRNWRHVYHLRRANTHAAPELQEAVELVRSNITKWNYTLGIYLGKVWCANDKFLVGEYYCERNKVRYAEVE
jgi:hypothetical protein